MVCLPKSKRAGPKPPCGMQLVVHLLTVIRALAADRARLAVENFVLHRPPLAQKRIPLLLAPEVECETGPAAHLGGLHHRYTRAA